MKLYQFVIQFPGDSLVDYDAMIEIENELERMLIRPSEKLSGHDMGSDQRNIFLWTSGPKITFQKCLAYLQERGVTQMKIGYRDFDKEEDFHVLWPTDPTAVLSVL